MYISAHSAETILSDFRPLKLQTDALSFLNLLLDDILANIITSSRSIVTDRLKTGLLKTIPTTIGKDALLEAEMELRAYWQRPNAVKPSPAQFSASEYSFSLPSMIELMRLKCEAYSTLNDEDEDAQTENSIQERLRAQGMEPPKSIIVAPAALYLTAILECICERILSSVGRVATRDSSKEAAGTHDLFVALCEDDAIYPVFKSSKVYGVIESSLKQPQRSKSFSRSERLDGRDSQLADPLSHSRSRLSSESAASGALSGPAGSDNYALRTSLEKGKAIKLFRPSSDRDASASIASDAVSRVSASRKVFGAQSDGYEVLDSEECNVTQDFDDLMRSGDTMKVSLTPDRLRTMETAKQQQQQRQSHNTPRRTGRITPNEHSRTLSAADADSRLPLSPDHGIRKPSVSHVDSIIEDEEPRETVVSPRAVQSRSPKPSDVRSRSVSTSGISHSANQRNQRKPSLSSLKTPPPSYNAPNHSPATPRRVRKLQRNRESMDIDDIMNGSEDGSESSPDPGDQPTQGRVPLYPVSKATKDFISFLEEGPPPEIQPARPATVSSVSLTPTTKSAKSGSRLQRMISKLSLSKEDRTFQDNQRGRGVGSASAPSTPTVSSLRSPTPSYLPPLPALVKPVPPPILSISPPAPISPPPSSQPSPDDDARSPITRGDRRPRKMSVRKAVPAWAETVDQGSPAPPTKDTPSPHPLPTSSTSLASPTPMASIPNGLAQPQSPPTPAPEAKEANGHVHNSHKSPRCDSPVAIHTPASTGLETPSHSPTCRDIGNGLAEKTAISRPRSSQHDHRLSMNGEQVNSGRRVSGRQPQPPTTQPIAPTPSLSESLTLDMRKLMLQATTADECRLLLDTFLTRAGIAPSFPPVLETTPSDVDSLEKSLVHHFLAADSDDSQSSPIHPVTPKPKRDSAAPTTEQPPVQDRNVLHQGSTTPMDSASAAHAHRVVNATVAVVS